MKNRKTLLAELAGLTFEQLNEMKQEHYKEVVVQRSIQKDIRMKAKAQVIAEMNEEFCLEGLSAEFAEKGALKTYLETGVILKREAEFYEQLDLMDVVTYFVNNTKGEESGEIIMTRWLNRHSVLLNTSNKNSLNYKRHVYEVFQDHFDTEMAKGAWRHRFEMIMDDLLASNEKAQEIKNHYLPQYNFHSFICDVIDWEIKMRACLWSNAYPKTFENYRETEIYNFLD